MAEEIFTSQQAYNGCGSMFKAPGHCQPMGASTVVKAPTKRNARPTLKRVVKRAELNGVDLYVGTIPEVDELFRLDEFDDLDDLDDARVACSRTASENDDDSDDDSDSDDDESWCQVDDDAGAADDWEAVGGAKPTYRDVCVRGGPPPPPAKRNLFAFATPPPRAPPLLKREAYIQYYDDFEDPPDGHAQLDYLRRTRRSRQSTLSRERRLTLLGSESPLGPAPVLVR